MTTRLVRPSLAGGEIGPAVYGRVDLDKYDISLKRCRNFIIHRTGGASSRPGLEYLGAVHNAAVSPALIEFRFNNTTQVCLLEFGDKTMRVWYDGALVLGSNTAPLVVTSPYTAAEAKALTHVQSNDVLYFAHRSHPPRKLSRHSWTDWRFAVVDFLPSIATPKTKLSVTGNGWLTSTTREDFEPAGYAFTIVDEDTGEESLPSDTVDGYLYLSTLWDTNTRCNLTLTYQSAFGDKSRILIKFYKYLNSRVLGYIGQGRFRSDTTITFVDKNIAPDITRQPPDGTNPFAGAGDYPGVVALHQQRLVWAATTNLPHGLWFSRTGFYENMSRSSNALQDDDSIDVVIASGEANEVRGLISVQDLIVLTSGSENVVNGGATGAAITPANIAIRPQSYWGAARLRPLVSGNTILFVQGLGHAVRDLGYDYSVDGFTGNDRAILAGHLLEGHTVIDWAYAQVPDSTLWLVRDDGVLLSLSYFREQEIGAWALHQTDGAVEAVAVLPGVDRHEVYMVVRRQVNGATRRYIERLASRRFDTVQDARCLDSWLEHKGAAVSTLSGLAHLEGRTVQALVDGSPVTDLVVKNGAVDLGRAGTNIVVGLPYPERSTCIETLPIDLGMVPGLGSVGGRRKKVVRLTLLVQDAREFTVGPGDDQWQKLRTVSPSKTLPERYDQPVPLYTGWTEITVPADWNRDGRLMIAPVSGLPLTVLSILQDIEVGG